MVKEVRETANEARPQEETEKDQTPHDANHQLKAKEMGRHPNARHAAKQVIRQKTVDKMNHLASLTTRKIAHSQIARNCMSQYVVSGRRDPVRKETHACSSTGNATGSH